MAGLAKPDVEGLGKEVEITLVDSFSYLGITGVGLTDGIQINEWNTERIFYWLYVSDYVVFDIPRKCNIWRSGSTTWASQNVKLKIEKWQDGVWEDVTDAHSLPTTAINETRWEKWCQDLPSGRYKFSASAPSIGRLDSEWYVEGVTQEKFLVKDSDGYKRYLTSGWELVTTEEPTDQDYVIEGMDDISAVPSSAWQELSGSYEVLFYTDSADSTAPVYGVEVEPFNPIMKLSPETISVEMWTNEEDEEIEVEYLSLIPVMTSNTSSEGTAICSSEYGTLYSAWKAFNGVTDEAPSDSWCSAAGKTGEWVGYSFNTPKKVHKYQVYPSTESVLFSPSTWRLEGSNNGTDWIEVHSVSEETGWVEGEYKEYFVPEPTEYLSYRLYVVNNSGGTYTGVGELLLYGVKGNEEGKSLVVEGQKHTKYRYKVLLDDETLKESDWIYGDTEDSVVIDSSYIKTINPYTVKVEVEQSNGVTVEEFGKVTLIDIEPTLVATMTGMRLDLDIIDPENDLVKFRVLLNGVQIYPEDSSKEFTDLAQSPVTYQRLLRSSEVNVDSSNTLQIIARDEFGKEGIVVLNFIGEFAGLMFADELGEFYSDDLGNVLQYLDVGILVAGQISETYPVRLINRTGFTVTNVELWKDRRTLPSSAEVEISRTPVPFEPVDLLEFNEQLEYNGEVTFYVRVVTQINGQPGQGEFDVYVKADPS